MADSDQYEEIRKTIKGNVAIIRQLLNQADFLYNIAQTVEDKNTKKKLTDSITELYKSIDLLIEQIDGLFDQYTGAAVYRSAVPVS